MRTDRPAVSPDSAARWARRLHRRDLVKTITVAGGAVVFAGYGRSTHAAAQDAIKLTQWYHQYGEEGVQDAVMRYAEEYTEANPNVEVEVVWNPGDYGAKLNAALVAGEAPDVFEFGTPPTIDMVKAGQIAPLDDLLTEEVRADFNPRDLATNTVDGKLYGIKQVVDTGLIYYRTSLLEEAGVEPPTTVDEVIAATEALNQGRVKGLFLGNDGGVSAMVDLLPKSAGSELIADQKIAFNNERTVAAYEKLRELRQSEGLLVGAPTDWHDPGAFLQGLTAMQWGGLWAMPAILETHGDDFGVMPWPAFDAEGTPVTFIGGWAAMVNAKSPNVEAAKQYVKWLWIDNREIQTDFNLSYGFHVPPRMSTAAEAEALKEGPAAQAVEALNEYGRANPPEWNAAMGTILLDAVSSIVNEGAPAAETVADAAARCEEELARVLGA
jgi:multiple sugar transport system substrate-binding protein